MKFSTIAKSLAWSGLEGTVISVLLLVTAIVLARILGPEEFGIASLALGLIFIPQMLVERLFHDVIIQRSKLTPSHLNTAFCLSLFIAIGLTIVIWFTSTQIAVIYNDSRLSSALRLATLCLLFNGASGVLIAYLRRKMFFKVLALRNLIAAFIGTAAGLTMAVNGFGLWSLIGQQVVQAFVGMLVVFSTVDRMPKLRFSKAHFRDLIGFSTIVAVSGTVWIAQLRFFLVLLGYISGPVVVGYFEIASRLVDSLRNIWLNTINPVALSIFSRLQHNQSELSSAFQQATEINVSVAFPVFAGLFVAAPEVVRVILGEPWVDSIVIVQMLSIAALLTSIRQFPPIIFNAKNRPHYNLIGSLIGLVVPFVMLYMFMPTTLLVQCFIWLGRLAFTTPVDIWFLRKVLFLSPIAQFKGVGTALLTSFIMVGVLWKVKVMFLSSMADIEILIVEVVLGACMYLVLMYFFSPHIIRRWQQMINEIRGG